ncbi:hypothetical protein ALC60_02601 [Trachymyrmex zeteki]|uniref:Uncharacterized protein n=1 Tax=Mycetomoellerius zeteki TaxID=64791 RepID=A0A151XCT6_9HYME|nr:hypothetical protein ALC60_02601 [Trachymyrmex zeteki]
MTIFIFLLILNIVFLLYVHFFITIFIDSSFACYFETSCWIFILCLVSSRSILKDELN